MDKQFIAILQKLIAEQGKDALLAKGKSLLEDYTGMDYQKERRLLVQVLEAGAAKAIDDCAGDLEACKEQQIRLLHEDYFLDEYIAAEVVDMLALVLRGDLAKTAPVNPHNMALIQGGTFLMGSPASEPGRGDDEIQHEVTVSSFYMGKYEVTQKEYQAVMGDNPSLFKGDNLPVEQVSWNDAVNYCNALSTKEGLTPAYTVKRTLKVRSNGYRLPTEAEWEYACRAGTTTPFNTGNSITTDQANYDGNYPYNKNAKGRYRKTTTGVGSFAPNPWGLYDMHGNVWEWCWDRYGDYSSDSQTDPLGASSGLYRVFRGGSWDYDGLHLRSADRGSSTPSKRYFHLGFRVVRPLVSAGGTADTRSKMPDQMKSP